MEIEIGDPVLALIPPDSAVVQLTEKGGARRLTLTLNVISFNLISWELEGFPNTKPMIFKFICECMEALKANIEKVVIYDAVNGTYHSHVVIKDEQENRTYQMPLHVTDAVALAIASKCRIFVTEEVFEKVQKELEKYPDRTMATEARMFFDEMNPDKMTKH